MKKFFTISKVGYSSGVYGCSGEYFLCVFVDDDGMNSFHFSGMYGEESRMKAFFKERGYQFVYSGNMFGKMTRDYYRGIKSGEEMRKEIFS